MFINKILGYVQKLLYPCYKNSVILQNIDWLIFINIILVIISSSFAQSDNIGYFALFAFILTIIKIIFKPNEKFIMSAGDKFLLLYFLIVLISVSGSTLLYLSFKGFCKTLIYIGFYISFIHYLKDNRDKLKYIILSICFIGLAEAFVAVHQNFLSVSAISGWQDMSRLNPEEVMTRVYGSLKPYNPNLFGGYMVSILPVSLLCILLPLKNHHYKTSLLGFLTFILICVSIILTGCRGAYIALFVELLLITLFVYRMLKPYYKKLFNILTTAISGVILFFIITLPALRARVVSIFAMRSDSSNSFRFNVYNSCIQMFKDNWLLGIGVGNQNFRETYGLYMRTGFDALSAYNIYLETAVESGIFALIAFLGFLYANLSKAIKFILRKNNMKSVYLVISVVSIAGMLVHGFVDTVFYRPQIQFMFWIMVGIIRVLVK